MIIDYLQGLGIIALIIGLILLICLPIIAGVIVAIALANYLAVSGILWWSIVILTTLIIWGIIGKLS